MQLTFLCSSYKRNISVISYNRGAYEYMLDSSKLRSSCSAIVPVYSRFGFFCLATPLWKSLIFYYVLQVSWGNLNLVGFFLQRISSFTLFYMIKKKIYIYIYKFITYTPTGHFNRNPCSFMQLSSQLNVAAAQCITSCRYSSGASVHIKYKNCALSQCILWL